MTTANRTDALHGPHRLIQGLGRDVSLQQRFAADPAAVFDEFGLTSEEVAALRDGSVPALASIGIHPALRMHWMMMSQPQMAAGMSVSEYLPRIRKAAAHG